MDDKKLWKLFIWVTVLGIIGALVQVALLAWGISLLFGVLT